MDCLRYLVKETSFSRELEDFCHLALDEGRVILKLCSEAYLKPARPVLEAYAEYLRFKLSADNLDWQYDGLEAEFMYFGESERVAEVLKETVSTLLDVLYLVLQVRPTVKFIEGEHYGDE